MKLKNTYFLLVICVALFSCKKDDEVNGNDIIPDVLVDFQLNLNQQDYLPLRQENGFVYVTGGVKGIIMYHQTGGTYSAFERNCPFQPSDDCARVEVDSSNFFMICKCCNSQFEFSGNVLSGPSRLPMKLYSTTLNGNYLRVIN